MADRDEGRHLADRRNQVERKERDIALLLPIIGALVLATPLLTILSEIFGGPLYFVFIVWAALILGAYFVARRLVGQGRGE